MGNMKFIKDKEKEFTEGFGDVLYYLGRSFDESDDTAKYETTTYIIQALAKMTLAFEQVHTTAYNLIDKVVEKGGE